MAVIPDNLADTFRNNHRQLQQYERRTRGRLRDLLKETMGNLRSELSGLDPGNWRRQQGSVLYLVSRALQEEGPQELEDLIRDINSGTRRLGLAHVSQEVGAWAAHFGAEIRGINLQPVAALEGTTLIEQYPRSLERYGQSLAREAARELQRIPLERINPDAAVDSIQRAIDGQRWRADRIVRTEMSHAYHTGHFEGLVHAKETGQAPGVKKSAIATFDSRTDQDSYPVHNQVRELEEPFVDGDGREYMHPPGRPNDREKEIPYFESAEALGGDAGDPGGTEVESREEGIRRSEAAKARLAARRRKRQARRRKRQDRSRKQRGLAPLERGDTFESRRAYHQLWWVNSSRSKAAIELKTAALEAFRLDGVVYNPRNLTVARELLEQTRVDVRRMWRDTVEELLEEGRESVTLYRGVKGDYAIEGTLESWSTSEAVARKFAGPNGRVIREEVDVRRILMRHDSDWWQNGRYGNQREYVVMPEVPRLEFEPDDWEIGFFRAREIDPDAEAAGQFGITQADGEATLYHRPTGRSLLEGPEYDRSDLRDVARDLDTGGFYTVRGELTERGDKLLDDTLDGYRAKYARQIDKPDGAPVEAFTKDGKTYAHINADVDPGAPDTWSRRTFKVVEDESGDVREVNGYTQKAIAIWREEGMGYRGSWNIGHLKTGKVFHFGPEEFYSKGNRVPFDIGGWQKRDFEEWADVLNESFDPETGAIIEGKREQLENVLENLEGQYTSVVPDDLSNVRGLDGDAMDDLDWLPGLSDDKPAKRFEKPVEEPELPGFSPARANRKRERDQTLQEAVDEYRAATRRSRVPDITDPELERAARIEVLLEETAETRRRQERALERRLEELRRKREGGNLAADDLEELERLEEIDPNRHAQDLEVQRKTRELEQIVEEWPASEPELRGVRDALEAAGAGKASGEELSKQLRQIREIRDVARARARRREAQKRIRRSQLVDVDTDRVQGMNVNETHFVTLEDPETGDRFEAIFKPGDGQHRDTLQAYGVEDMVPREVAAADVDEVFPGRRVVPATTRKRLEVPESGERGARLVEREGSVQRMHHSATADIGELIGEDYTVEDVERFVANSEPFHKMMMMDAVNGQWDRHKGNVLWTREAGNLEPVAIDNGLGWVGYTFEEAAKPRVPFEITDKIQGKLRNYAVKLENTVDVREYARRALEAGVEYRRVREATIRLRALQIDSSTLFDMPGDTWEDKVQEFVQRSRLGDELLEEQDLKDLEEMLEELEEKAQ